MIQAKTLALTGIRHAFFTREGGVSGGLYSSLNGGVGSRDSHDHVAENRARMAAALAVNPDHLLTVYQIHSPNVVIADAPWTAAARPRADAIVTRKPGLAIGVSTADCGPILFADTRAGVVGAAHAGWRGALAGVAEATIEAMERLGAARDQIRAALGPMIRQAELRGRSRSHCAIRRRGCRQRSVLCPGRPQRPCPVRSQRLHRLATRAGRRPADRGCWAVHLCGPGAIFQFPPIDPSGRGGLWPACQRDRAGLRGK